MNKAKTGFIRMTGDARGGTRTAGPGKKLGKPPKVAGQVRVSVNLTLDPDVLDGVNLLARTTHSSRSEVVNHAVRNWLDLVSGD